jgi:hypothetical protein
MQRETSRDPASSFLPDLQSNPTVAQKPVEQNRPSTHKK